MSKESLWTDAKIKALTVLAASTVDPQARWMHERIAKDMRNDYECALAFRNEDIGRLQGEVKTQAGHIAELEAEVKRLRELVYLAHDTECTCEICVATPHDPIICCICGQPITGIEIDHRFWLHRIGCNGGECDCDLECCADCCPVCSGNNHDEYWCDSGSEREDE